MQIALCPDVKREKVKRTLEKRGGGGHLFIFPGKIWIQLEIDPRS